MLTEEQILDLAPDDASKKAGLGLVNSRDWERLGADATALWGECQGSGQKPYQVQIDTAAMAFKCSCPSRKFPCKHGLGLLLTYCKAPQIFNNHTQPDWVATWIGKRQDKAAAATDAPAKPADEAAQMKRTQARNKKVGDGIDDLILWLKDIVRNGLLSLPGKEAALQDMGRRMIDAQAGGLAAVIRGFEDINF